MPLYEVWVHKKLNYFSKVWAASPEAAVDAAVEEAVLPYIGEGWDEDDSTETSTPVKIAENGEDDL